MALIRPNFPTNNVQSLQNRIVGQASVVKQTFDKAAVDIKEYLEDLCDQLDEKFSIPDGGAAAMAVEAYNEVNALKAESVSVLHPPAEIAAWAAKGDGVTDDTESVNKIIEWIGNTNKPRKLYFPSGTYIISSSINLIDDLMIYGDAGTSILYMADDVSCNMLYAHQKSNIIVTDLVFDGNKDNNPFGAWPDTASQSIFFPECKNTIINRCIFKNCYRAICVANDSVQNNFITNNTFIDCAFGIDNYGSRAIIMGNIFDNTTEYPIQIEPSVLAPYINYESGNEDDFIGWNDEKTYAANVQIIGNVVNGGLFGVVIHQGSYDVNVSNNIIVNMAQMGIYIKENTTRINVHDNIIRHIKNNPSTSPESPWSSGGGGIVATNCSASIVDNTIEFAHTGIYINNPVRAQVKGNKIFRCRTSPICAQNATEGRLTIESNYCYGSPTYDGIVATYYANGGVVVYNCADIVVIDNIVVGDYKGRAYAAVFLRNSGRIHEKGNTGINTRHRVDGLSSGSTCAPIASFAGNNRKIMNTFSGQAPNVGFYTTGSIILCGSIGLGRPIGYIATSNGGAYSADWAPATAYSGFVCVKTTNGRIIQADNDGGTSGNTSPDDLVITDGTATWKMSTGATEYWQPETSYSSGQKIKFSDELSYECVTGGTSGTIEPLGIFVDNNISWRYIAESAATFEPFGQIGYRTHAGTPNETPYFVGEELLDTTNGKWYKAKGLTSSDWVALN